MHARVGRFVLVLGAVIAVSCATRSGDVSGPGGGELSQDSGVIARGDGSGAVDAGVTPITYTVEPFDFDGTSGITFTMTQAQLHGTLCPCMKIPYIADGFHNQEGADAIWKAVQKGIFKAGDNLMGFSLGSQVISLFLSQHSLPPGVRVILLGDTFARNDVLVSEGHGVPPDITNPVLLVANQYDGWSDQPTNTSAPDYAMAVQNAVHGQSRLHNYLNAKLDHPANVVNVRGNITAIRIPTQYLPQNYWARQADASTWADETDAEQRPKIDAAYDPSVVPTPEQLAAATDEQVGPEGSDMTSVPQTPEAVVDLE